MSNARFFSAIALTAVVTGTLVAGLTLSSPARADEPKTAICTGVIEPAQEGTGTWAKMLPGYTAPIEAWMTARLAEGRTQFTLAPLAMPIASGTGRQLALCAW